MHKDGVFTRELRFRFDFAGALTASDCRLRASVKVLADLLYDFAARSASGSFDAADR